MDKLTIEQANHNMDLWIQNDEDLYTMAYGLITMIGHNEGAKEMWNRLRGSTTPDGIAWTFHGIKQSLLSIEA